MPKRIKKCRIPNVWVLLFAVVFISMPLAHSAAWVAEGDTVKADQPFVITDARGMQMNVTGLRNKVVFVNFWSLTCVPCKTELPTIDKLRSHYRHDTDFYVLPVDLDRNFKGDAAYFSKKGLGLAVYAPAGVVPQALFKGELPTTAVIDKQGKIVFLKQGGAKYNSPAFFNLIDSLLRQ